MELLERYLQAVSRHLPRRRQQDILAELRANLEAQLEDKEAELGRELKQGEAEDWLRELGSPMQVAARYMPQQWLIGPGIFPVYWYALRLALVWALGIYAIVSTVLIVLGQPGASSIAGAIWRAPWVLFEVAAWVTLTFAAMEFFAARFPAQSAPLMKGVTEWSPASLAKLEKLEKLQPHGAPKSYAHAVAEVVFGFLFLVWLALIPEYPFLLVGPGLEYLRQSPFVLAPTVMVFYYWVLALNVLQVGWQGVDLLRGAWQRPRRLQHLVFKAFAVIPMVVLLRAPGHALVLLKADAAHYGATVAALNDGVHKGLLVVLVIVVAQFVWELSQWLLGLRRDGGTA